MNMRETVEKILITAEKYWTTPEVVAAWVDYVGDTRQAIDTFADAYQGVYNSIAEFWMEYLENNDGWDFDFRKVQELCQRLNLHTPEVDTISVEQTYYQDDETGAVFDTAVL